MAVYVSLRRITKDIADSTQNAFILYRKKNGEELTLPSGAVDAVMRPIAGIISFLIGAVLVFYSVFLVISVAGEYTLLKAFFVGMGILQATLLSQISIVSLLSGQKLFISYWVCMFLFLLLSTIHAIPFFNLSAVVLPAIWTALAYNLIATIVVTKDTLEYLESNTTPLAKAVSLIRNQLGV